MANIPIQDNNPGDLKDPATGTFRTFQNPTEGYGALLNDLQAKITAHPTWNLSDFSNVYAPPSDNNDTASYTAKLANQLGVAPNTPISQLQPKIGAFAQAVAKNEGFNGTTATPPQTPQTQPQSNGTDWLDTALGIAAPIGAAGLTLAALLQGGADVPNDVAAGAADAAVAPEVSSWFGNAAKKIGTGAAIDLGIQGTGGILNSFSGGSGGGGGGTTPPVASPSQPNLPPSNESMGSTFQPIPQPASTPEQLNAQIPQAAQNSQQVQQTLNQTLRQAGTKGASLAQEQEAQMGVGAMSRYGGLLGTTDENNKYDSTGTDENADALVEQMDKGERGIYSAEGSKGQTQEGIEEALAGNKQTVNAPDRDEADRHAKDIINAYAGDYADKDGNIDLGHWHDIYSKEGKAFESNASNARNAAHKSVAMAARRMIEKHTYHKEFFNKMQKEKQAIIKSKEINKFLNGKKIPKNKSLMRDLLKQGGGALGIYIGDKVGGPLGAILGNMVGEHISRAADKRHGINIFESKGMREGRNQIKDQSPVVAQVIEREISKAKQEKAARDKARESQLKLPAPKGIPMGARQGETKSVVVGGKRPPATFEQAMHRKRGEKEYGGFAKGYFEHLQRTQKAAGIKK